MMGIIEDQIKEAAVNAGYRAEDIDDALKDLTEKGILNKSGDGLKIDSELLPVIKEMFKKQFGEYKRVYILGKERKVRLMDLTVLGLSFEEMKSLPPWEEKYGA